MMAAAALYTADVLALATSLADYGWDEKLPLKGSARSRSCGSTVDLGISTDTNGRVHKIAIKSQACAIGQAAAALFASEVEGRNAKEIHLTRDALKLWLAGAGPMPDWHGLERISAARNYPGRHGAIMLAWDAACDLLPIKR